MTKIAKTGVLILSAVLLLCACANNVDFYGGELLDSERMSEIKSAIFATEAVESEENSKKGETENVSETVKSAEEIESSTFDTTESVESTPSDKTTDSVYENTEMKSETKEQESEYNESMEDTFVGNEDQSVVYWTKNGSVWHTSRDCRYIRNSEVESGDVNDAIEAGKDRVCSSCGN